ncbi:MAG: hypothetical protein KBG62_06240 [Propionivibrio sp.]|nr:hypothetical protein [Propionivibrio sp.]
MEKKVKVIIAETVGMNVPILVLACLVPSRLTVLLALVFLAVTAAIMATSWSAWKRYLLVSVGYGALGAAFVSVNTGVGAIWSLGIFSLLVSATVDYIFDTGYFDFVENMTFSSGNSNGSLGLLNSGYPVDQSGLEEEPKTSSVCMNYLRPQYVLRHDDIPFDFE